LTALGFEVERLDRSVPLALATLSLALWGVAEVPGRRLFAGLLAHWAHSGVRITRYQMLCRIAVHPRPPLFRLSAVAAILNVTARPVDIVRVRLRVRYDFEDIWDNHRLPQSLWANLDAALTVRDRDMLRVRYDVRVFLDSRESTGARVPNPEHWLWVEYVFRY
jgi:hypothetical protein